MSPEQLQRKNVDARSDLFSFGCVLYEMLTGTRAFQGESAASVIAAILEREPAPMMVALPPERILKRALAKDPDQRFQTACDLKAALTWALEQPSVSAAAKPGRRWKIAAAALVIGGLLGGWIVSRFLHAPSEALPYRFEINPPEGSRFTFGNNIGGLALSPDGRTAAYATWGGGLKKLSDWREDDLFCPVFSPKGDRMVAFAYSHVFTALLFDPRRPWTDQQPVKLSLEVPDGIVVPNKWSPDGLRLAGYILRKAGGRGSLAVYEFATKKVRPPEKAR
jgi:hypothetical protein